MGNFKKGKAKAQAAERLRKADERTAAEASAADADGHADGNADDAGDAGAQSSSGGGGSSSGGLGGGGEQKVNLRSLISSTKSKLYFRYVITCLPPIATPLQGGRPERSGLVFLNY